MFTHFHKWQETGRRFVQSQIRNISSIKAKDDETLERIAFGITVVELQCRCGLIISKELKGDHT